MTISRALVGTLVGATIATLWIVLDTGAVAIIIALALVGWLIGTMIDRPDVFIGLLERLQDR